MEALGIDQKGMEHGSAQHRQLMTGTFGEGQGQPWGLGGGRNLPVKLRDDPVLQQFRGLSRLSTDQANPIKVKLFPCGIISKDRMRKIKNCSNDNNDKPNINKRKSCGGLWTFQATSRPGWALVAGRPRGMGALQVGKGQRDCLWPLWGPWSLLCLLALLGSLETSQVGARCEGWPGCMGGGLKGHWGMLGTNTQRSPGLATAVLWCQDAYPSAPKRGNRPSAAYL